MVLMAVLDWFSRYVVSWRLSNTLDTGFCVEALNAALDQGQPLIFNTDQGAQFTSTEWIERLWRMLKCEDIYLRGYDSPAALERALIRYIDFYNEEQPHAALDRQNPG